MEQLVDRTRVVTVATRVPPTLWRRLKGYATRTGQPVWRVCIQALTYFLDEMDARAKIVALQRWERGEPSRPNEIRVRVTRGRVWYDYPEGHRESYARAVRDR